VKRRKTKEQIKQTN